MFFWRACAFFFNFHTRFFFSSTFIVSHAWSGYTIRGVIYAQRSLSGPVGKRGVRTDGRGGFKKGRLIKKRATKKEKKKLALTLSRALCAPLFYPAPKKKETSITRKKPHRVYASDRVLVKAI